MRSRVIQVLITGFTFVSVVNCERRAPPFVPPTTPISVTLTGTLTTGVAGGWILVRPNETPVNVDIIAVKAAAEQAQLKSVTVTGTYNAQGTLVLTGLK
ncbi:MAG: hypothetical protein AABZ53_09285 [Planctomycetota bacterium]